MLLKICVFFCAIKIIGVFGDCPSAMCTCFNDTAMEARLAEWIEALGDPSLSLLSVLECPNENQTKIEAETLKSKFY